MDSIQSFFKWLESEWAAIGSAPFTFAIAVVIAGFLVWRFVKHEFNTRLSNKESSIELLERQLADYKDKLSGASPDAAKAKIDALEARLDALEPRTLSEAAQAGMVPILDAFRGQHIHITSDASSADASRLARQLQIPFNSAGWNVLLPTVIGIGDPPRSGVGLIVQTPEHLTPEQQAVADALSSANLEFNLQAGPQRPEMLGEMNPVAEILITNPH